MPLKEICENCWCWTREGRPGTGVCHYSPLSNPVKGEGDWCVQGFNPKDIEAWKREEMEKEEELLRKAPPSKNYVFPAHVGQGAEEKIEFVKKNSTKKK